MYSNRPPEVLMPNALTAKDLLDSTESICFGRCSKIRSSMSVSRIRLAVANKTTRSEQIKKIYVRGSGLGQRRQAAHHPSRREARILSRIGGESVGQLIRIRNRRIRIEARV